jgi:hypothetical protein
MIVSSISVRRTVYLLVSQDGTSIKNPAIVLARTAMVPVDQS